MTLMFCIYGFIIVYTEVAVISIRNPEVERFARELAGSEGKCDVFTDLTPWEM